MIGAMALLDTPERDRFVREHPEWEVKDAEIRRTFAFDDFGGSMGFVTRVALAAEKANHHPDIDIRYNKVRLTLTTHEAEGITDKDLDLAERVDFATSAR